MRGLLRLSALALLVSLSCAQLLTDGLLKDREWHACCLVFWFLCLAAIWPSLAS